MTEILSDKTQVDLLLAERLMEASGGDTISDPTATIRTAPLFEQENAPNPWTAGASSKGARTVLHAGSSSHSGEFEVVFTEHIGSGGVANVDAATQLSLAREVAVKRPKDDTNPEIIHRSLIQEAQMMAQLDHPNIPPIHELAYDDVGNPMLVMKRIQGVTWSTLIQEPNHKYWSQQAQDPLHVHLRILIQVCHAMEYAHSKGILHRDIKPENVMVGNYGEVYLLDWGFAVSVDEEGEHWIDAFYGTPKFAAPEMFTVHEPLTVRTDVYLLGATLHYVLTRKYLHQGDLFSDIIVSARMSPPFAYEDTVHSDLGAITNRATHKKPERRFQDIAALRRALEEHLSHFHVMDLLSSAQENRKNLERTLESGSYDLFTFYQRAFQGQFACQKVLDIRPTNEDALRTLSECLLLLLRHEIKQGHMLTSERLLDQIKRMPHDEVVLEALERRYEQLQEDRQRSGELTTQIQYKLLEKLQDQQPE
jgi:serine/threonine-protein kinase